MHRWRPGPRPGRTTHIGTIPVPRTVGIGISTAHVHMNGYTDRELSGYGYGPCRYGRVRRVGGGDRLTLARGAAGTEAQRVVDGRVPSRERTHSRVQCDDPRGGLVLAAPSGLSFSRGPRGPPELSLVHQGVPGPLVHVRDDTECSGLHATCDAVELIRTVPRVADVLYDASTVTELAEVGLDGDV